MNWCYDIKLIQYCGGKVMVLVLDVGNTNIVLGGYRENTLEFTARLSAVLDRTSQEMAVVIRDILSLYNVNPKEIEGSIISSVVPPVTEALSEGIELLVGKQPLIVGPGIKTGLDILIDNPAQMGSDIVVNAVAAIAKYPKPIIIFDMGTATTISVINEKGQHLGGIIFPGVRTSLDALSNRTAQLPHISIETPDKVIGKNTIDSMRSGIIFGSASMIEGMISKIEDELGQKCTVIATGGLSKEIIKHVKMDVNYNSDLLLEGLFLLYNKNCLHK